MSSVRRLAMVALVGVAAAWCVTGGAQQVYRIVGPDGRVTFSDRPPTDPGTKAEPAKALGMGGGGGPALPFELRGVVSRYPVVLYSGPDCGPCASARSFLTARGVPFSEKTVNTEDDVDALRRLTGAPRVPLVTIGSQQIRGFSEAEIGSFLDAAGYPRTSQLPAGYKNPEPTPMVAAQSARKEGDQAQQPGARPQQAARPSPTDPTGASAASPPSDPAPANPAGIRF